MIVIVGVVQKKGENLDDLLNFDLIERQLRRIEKRLSELRDEQMELLRKRQACHVLLDKPAPKMEDVSVGWPTSRDFKRARIPGGMHSKIKEVLIRKTQLSVPEIFNELKESGIPLKSHHPNSAIYVALKRHPDLFIKDGFKWRLKLSSLTT